MSQIRIMSHPLAYVFDELYFASWGYEHLFLFYFSTFCWILKCIVYCIAKGMHSRRNHQRKYTFTANKKVRCWTWNLKHCIIVYNLKRFSSILCFFLFYWIMFHWSNRITIKITYEIAVIQLMNSNIIYMFNIDLMHRKGIFTISCYRYTIIPF